MHTVAGAFWGDGRTTERPGPRPCTSERPTLHIMRDTRVGCAHTTCVRIPGEVGEAESLRCRPVCGNGTVCLEICASWYVYLIDLLIEP